MKEGHIRVRLKEGCSYDKVGLEGGTYFVTKEWSEIPKRVYCTREIEVEGRKEENKSVIKEPIVKVDKSPIKEWFGKKKRF